MPWIDRARTYDPATHRCDRAFDGVDVAIDATPVTPVLLALGCNRRAQPGDVLPDTVTNAYQPSRLNARGGWAGDALDAAGRLIGSRLWLISRAKQTEATRSDAQSYVAEALDPLNTQRGWSISVLAMWVRRGFLGIRTRIDGVPLTITLPAGG